MTAPQRFEDWLVERFELCLLSALALFLAATELLPWLF
jgi:hypothetical protein